MKYKTLSKEEACKAFKSNSYTAEMTLVAGDKRFPFRRVSDAAPWFRPRYGPDLKSWMDATTVHHLIATGIAHIEVPEPEPFAHPAFEGWEITSDRDGKTASRAGFRMYGRGILDYEQSFVRHFNPEDAPAIAESVNRLVAIGEVSE